MSTSGQIGFNMTARDVIRRAMQKAAILSPGEAPTDNEAQDAVTDLNLMLKSWQIDANLWRQAQDSVTVTSAETVLDPRVIDVIEARLERFGQERPLTRWEWGDYVSIPNKAQAGQPTCFVVRNDRDSTRLIVWPVPASAVINFTAARVIEDVVSLNDNLDVPQEWLECVVLNLAKVLAPSYGAALPPEDSARADMLLAQMRAMDRPASYNLGPWR